MIIDLLFAIVDPTNAEVGGMVKNLLWVAGALVALFKVLDWVKDHMPSRRVQNEHNTQLQELAKRLTALEDEKRYAAADEARHGKHLKIIREWIEKHDRKS